MASPNLDSRPLLIEVSAGELIDKITILEIKSERMTDAAKLENVRTELDTLLAVQVQALAGAEGLLPLAARLREINEQLWDIEDAIRQCEARQDFGPTFIELARSVYHINDQRARVKREINTLVGSRLVEEKDYQPYEQPSQ